MSHRRHYLRQFKDYLLYGLLRFLLLFLRLIPFTVGRRLALGLSHLAYLLMRKRREIAFLNLKTVFGGEKNDEEIWEIVKKYFDNFLLSAVETAYFLSWNEKEVKERIRVVNLEKYQKVQKRGRGVIIVTPHFGNFALGAHAFGPLVHPAVIVVPGKDKVLARLLKYLYSRLGNRVISKGGAVAELAKALEEGLPVILTIDQRAGHGNQVVPVGLFGRKFYFNKGSVRLARMAGSPILACCIFRRNDGSHQIVFLEEISLIKTEDQEADLQINMNRMIATLESAIRQAPDHWWYWAWSGFEKEFGATPMSKVQSNLSQTIPEETSTC